MVALASVYLFAVQGAYSTWSLAYGAFFPTYFNCSLSTLSYATTVGLVLMLLIGMFGSNIIIRLQAKKTMMIGAVSMAGFFLIIASSQNVVAYYLAWAVISVAGSIGLYPAANHLVIQWYYEDRATMTGILVGVSTFGMFFYQTCIGFLLDSLGVRVTFLIVGASVLALGFGAALLVKDTPYLVGQLPYGFKAENTQADKIGAEESKEKAHIAKQLYKSPMFWCMFFGFVFASQSCCNSANYLSMFLPPLGFNVTTATTLTASMNLISGVLMMTVVGKAVHKFGVKAILFVALTFAILNNLVMIILGAVPSVVVITVMMITYALGYGMYNMYNFLTPALYEDSEAATIASTRCVAAMNGGGMILTPVMANVIESMGFNALWSMIAILDFVGLVFFVVMFKLRKTHYN